MKQFSEASLWMLVAVSSFPPSTSQAPRVKVLRADPYPDEATEPRMRHENWIAVQEFELRCQNRDRNQTIGFLIDGK